MPLPSRSNRRRECELSSASAEKLLFVFSPVDDRFVMTVPVKHSAAVQAWRMIVGLFNQKLREQKCVLHDRTGFRSVRKEAVDFVA
jgi:hypothetical protein